jgi:hypothetical protein
MLPGVQHNAVMVRHVARRLLAELSLDWPEQLHVVEASSDTDGIDGHSKAELLALMSELAPGVSQRILESFVRDCA